MTVTSNPSIAMAIAAEEIGSIPRLNHGRDPAMGLDCLGLVLWLYAQAGVDLSNLDQPYGESAQHDPRNSRRAIAVAIKQGGFREAHPFSYRSWRTGDLVLIRAGLPGVPRTMHLGVVIGDETLHFADRLYRTPNQRLSPWVSRVLRHPAFLRSRR